MAKDTSTAVTVTMPKSLKRISAAQAKAMHLSLSAFVSRCVRDYFEAVEKGMR